MVTGYRKKGILALIAVFPEDDWPIIFFERQIYTRSKTESEYFFNIYQLCGDVLSGKNKLSSTLKLGFGHENWDDVRQSPKEKEVIVVEDSVLQCRKCKSNKVISHYEFWLKYLKGVLNGENIL